MCCGESRAGFINFPLPFHTLHSQCDPLKKVSPSGCLKSEKERTLRPIHDTVHQIIVSMLTENTCAYPNVNKNEETLL